MIGVGGGAGVIACGSGITANSGFGTMPRSST
jgi:hypothetical protein